MMENHFSDTLFSFQQTQCNVYYTGNQATFLLSHNRYKNIASNVQNIRLLFNFLPITVTMLSIVKIFDELEWNNKK